MKSYKIKEFADVITGGTPSTSVKEYWENGTIPWLNSGDLNQEIITFASNYITEAGLKNSSTRLMPPNSVLIALTGATTGKTALLTFEACANQSVTGILPSDYHIPKYLYYYLQTRRENILKISWGGAQKHINQAYVKDLQIPLPSLEEQKQIADTLDKADALRQKRKQSIQLLHDYLESVFYDMFGDLNSNNMKWKYFKISDIVEKNKNSIKAGPFGSSLKKECYVDSGYKIYGQEQVIRDDFTYGDYYINKEKFDSLKNYAIKKGDILISLVGTYGKISIVPKNFEQGIINPRLMKLSLSQDLINLIFFKFLFTSEEFKKKMSVLSHGGTMDILNIGILKEMKIPVPPLSLQTQFSHIVVQVDQIKSKMEESLKEIDNLFNSLMNKFFGKQISK